MIPKRPWRLRWLACALAALTLPAAGLWPGRSAAQGAGGLKMTVLSLGRRGSYVTAAVKIHNGSNRIFFVALGGPPPLAIDGAGTSYAIRSLSGVARCDSWDVVPICIGVPRVVQGTLPLQGYTRIDPDADIFLSLEFYGRESRAPQGTVSASLIYRSVPDDLRDEAMSDDQKRRQLGMLNLGAPPVEITDGSR